MIWPLIKKRWGVVVTYLAGQILASQVMAVKQIFVWLAVGLIRWVRVKIKTAWPPTIKTRTFLQHVIGVPWCKVVRRMTSKFKFWRENIFNLLVVFLLLSKICFNVQLMLLFNWFFCLAKSSVIWAQKLKKAQLQFNARIPVKNFKY